MLMKKFGVFFAIISLAAASTSSFQQSPWECDSSSCLEEITTINDNECLPWDEWPHILKPSTFAVTGKHCIALNENSPILVCPKIINGIKLLASCGEYSTDFRIPCTPAKDSMKWYRGIKSTTFNDTKCLRWDEVEMAQEKFSNFFDFSDPSFGTHSIGIHSHENFCRNPDSYSAGPWCYIEGGSSPRRQPCFLQCKPAAEDYEDVDLPCLSRIFLSSIPSIRNSTTKQYYFTSLPMKNPPKWVSQYLIQSSQYSYSQHCYYHDERAKIFGPWTFVASLNDEQFRSKKNVLPGDTDKFSDSWERCYLGCEDFALTCIPSLEFSYFGPKQISIKGNECVSPNFLKTLLQKTFEENNNNEERFKRSKPKLWQMWKLFGSGSLGTVANKFYRNSIDRLTNAHCFNYRSLISDIDFNDFYALKEIFESGVGCFVVEIDKDSNQLISVAFEPCFDECPANSSAPEFSIMPKLLENETVFDDSAPSKSHISPKFEDKLDTGNSLPAILLLAFASIAIVAAMIVCILHVFNKV